MFLTAPRGLSKRVIITLVSALLFAVGYFRFYFSYEHWYLSSGDRVLSNIKFSQSQPSTAQTTSIRTDSAIISLVRNEELDGIVSSMRQLEASWNSKYNYPWIFFNNVPFSEEFKARTQAETEAECRYGNARLIVGVLGLELIPEEHWAVPDWIDPDLLKQATRKMKKQGIKYAGLLSYHQMCRWNSGFFYRHPALEAYKYYWRVEPDVKFFCDITYDPFQFMADHNKTYGFTINIFDDPSSVASLWPETQSFLKSHPDYLSADNSLMWLTDRTLRPDHTNTANGYSTCHFWSNFEIGDLDFWRSEKYQQYFEHLDQSGGFFYERWGDAPVHSIALGLFEDNSRIHWFRDIGYQHPPYINCPDTSSSSSGGAASGTCQNCKPNIFTHSWGVMNEDCRVNWFRQMCQSRTRHRSTMLPDEDEICRQAMNFGAFSGGVKYI
uniref:Putative mannosyltransferase KTR4 n=1 Tax=Talaromyces marneffei PM1 TaxID=1077442 RepID=A0A093VYW8_TALMA